MVIFFIFLFIICVGLFVAWWLGHIDDRTMSALGVVFTIIAALATVFALIPEDPNPERAEEPPTATSLPLTEAPKLGIGSTKVGKDGMTLLYVPQGEFLMGSKESDPHASDGREFPQRLVDLDAFWIDQTEVSNEMYATCVNAGVCGPPSSNKSETRDSYYDNSQYSNYPVIYVSWDDARTYCEWAERGLPTEAQWEKAARGTDGWIYPWGNQFIGERLNYCDSNCPEDNSHKDESINDGYADTAPVDHYPAGASPYGALNMVGNVEEWVADWYQADYYKDAPSKNPTGPESGTERVLRGSSWRNSGASVARTARRHKLSPDNNHRSDFRGFRCAALP